MSILITLASLAYFISTWLLLARIKGFLPSWGRPATLGLAAIAVSIHGFLLWGTLFDSEHIRMGLGLGLSLAGWLSALLILIGSIRHTIETLGFFVFPLSLISLWLAPLLPTPYTLEWGVGIHALLSLVAYSLLSVAAAQAVLVKIQEKRLRQRQWHGLFGALPPLATMEQLLFEWLIASFILLTLALISGALFIENIIAQQVAHKTLLSLLSWLLLAVLLWGHHYYGWRGQKAARMVLWGYALVVLGYVGSQFVIEVLLA